MRRRVSMTLSQETLEALERARVRYALELVEHGGRVPRGRAPVVEWLMYLWVEGRLTLDVGES